MNKKTLKEILYSFVNKEYLEVAGIHDAIICAMKEYQLQFSQLPAVTDGQIDMFISEVDLCQFNNYYEAIRFGITSYRDGLIPASSNTVKEEIETVEFPNDTFEISTTKTCNKVITEVDKCECGHIVPLGFIIWNQDGDSTCINCINDILIDRLVKKNKQIKSLKNKLKKIISSAPDIKQGKEDYKTKYEKCIKIIKKFDAGIIGMYDL
jgi:hypothetical protein